MNFKFFKKAFTLAEVLMVMGIIGVVAMLTITNARKDTEVAEKVMQLRKCEEIISAAFAQAVAEDGDVENWSESKVYSQMANDIWDVVSPHLKLQKNCGTDTGCWKDGKVGSLPYSDKESSAVDSKSMYSGILSNGASIAIGTILDGAPHITDIYVDVDGPDKGTYRFGDDVFTFYVTKEGEIIPYGYNAIDDCRTSRGSYCTAWVLTFGNQDYLKPCGSELNWDTKQTCK